MIHTKWNFFYNWLTPLLALGYKRPLEEKDLFELTDELKSEQLTREFKLLKNSLKYTIYYLNRKDILLAAFCLFLNTAIQLSQPIIIEFLIVFVTKKDIPSYLGYVYCVALFFMSLFNVFLQNKHNEFMTTVGYRVRTQLSTAIFNKALTLHYVNAGQIVNLLSTDTQSIDIVFQFIHLLWTAPLQLFVALGLLIRALGVSAIVGVGLLILISPFQAYVLKYISQLKRRASAITDERVKMTLELLTQIKLVKFYAYENKLSDNIKVKRAAELNLVQKFLISQSVINGFAIVAPVISMLLTFVTFYLLNGYLEASIVFSSVALFNVLRIPLLVFPMVLSGLATALVGIGRIQTLLLTESQFKIEGQNAQSKEKEQEIEVTVAISFSNATVTYPSFALKNLNLKIPKGSLTMIVGSVGSGKSCLLNAMIGEMQISEGSLKLFGTLGYAPQSAWIQNASLRDNVLFGKPFVQETYDAAIDACALQPDLEMLPAGDQTEIGERGINLSGGQRQRVNLARVVYFDPDIVLLDDPLSAVDTHVGKHLFENCINGLLKTKTRVLVTHQWYLAPRADHIVFMNEGVIECFGSYSECMEKSKRFKELMDEFGQANKNEGKAAGAKKETKEKTEAKALMSNEERSMGSVGWSVYLAFMNAAGGVCVVLTVLISLLILSQLTRIASDAWLNVWIGNIFSLSSATYIGIYTALGIMQGLVQMASRAMFSIYGVWAAKKMHNDTLERVIHAPMSFFDTTPIGRIINRFSKDVDAMDNQLSVAISTFGNTFLLIIATLIVIAVITPTFCSVLVPLCIIYYFAQKYYRSTARELKRLDLITRSPLYAHFSETMSGLATIRAYNEQERFIQKTFKCLDRTNLPYYLLFMSQRWISMRIEGTSAFLIFASALFIVLARDNIDPGFAGLSLAYALQVTAVLNWSVRQAADAETYMSSVERLEFYSAQITQESSTGTKALDWPTKGELVFENVIMSYREGLPPVLNGISFSVKGGEKIGFVGRTGAGKSSIMIALFRLSELTKGRIMIDGVDLSTLDLQTLRSNLCILPQDAVLFSDALRANLDPIEQFTDDEIWSALEKANLKKFVSELPEKLDTVVSTDKLSAGQRQLFLLAKVLLQKPKLLVLDEATSSMDSETDSHVQDVLRKFDCTVLMIAHRLDTVMGCDRVIVVGEGSVSEEGNPQELREKGGVFSGMIGEMN